MMTKTVPSGLEFWHRLPVARSSGLMLLACGLAACLHLAGVLQPFSNALSDARYGWFSRAPSGEVMVVEIDSPSLAAIGNWPWRREIIGEAVEHLAAAGASLVAVDIDLSTPSNPASDKALADSLSRTNGIVALPGFRQQLAVPGSAEAFTRPLPEFTAVTWTALVDVKPDSDGRVRRISQGSVINGEPLVSMSTYLSGREARIGTSFAVNFSIDARRIDRLSFQDVLANRFDPARVAGRKIIVGATAAELRDFLPVPMYGNIAGPVLQALGAETIIAGKLAQPAPLAAYLIGVVLIAFAFVFLLHRLPIHQLLTVSFAMSLGIEASAALQQHWGEVTYATAVWHVTLLGASAISIGSELVFRRRALRISTLESQRLKVILDRVIVENLEGIVVADATGRVVSISEQAMRMLGISADKTGDVMFLDEVIPQNLREPIDLAIREFRANKVRPREPLEITFINNGETAVFEYVVTVARGEQTGTDDFVVCLHFRDVTQRKHDQAQVIHLARTDGLTGLVNRRVFLAGLQDAVAFNSGTKSISAVLFIDIARFKTVNDGFGQHIGDALLASIGQRLAAICAPEDLVARLGGDEFAILRRNATSVEELQQFGAAITGAIAAAFRIEAYVLNVKARVGIAPIRGGVSASDLMVQAGIALMATKAEDGPQIRLYDADLHWSVQERKALEDDLRQSIIRGEIAVVYQVQIDLKTELPVGVEALARWKHATKGNISPAVFIAMAEQIGFINELGEYILERACEDAAFWPTPLPVAVNVSPIQFTRGTIVETCRNILQRTNLPPERLVIEITESIIIGDPDHICNLLNTLRADGIGVAIDDFGVGYSSLAYLQHLPIDKVKIDQTFVKNLPHDTSGAAIIRAVASIAEHIGFTLVAEGVETEEQAAFLRLLGCPVAQGYLYSKPIPNRDFIELLNKASTRRMSA